MARKPASTGNGSLRKTIAGRFGRAERGSGCPALLFLFFTMVFLFASCANDPNVLSLISPDPTSMPVRAEIYFMEDYKGMEEGLDVPEWVAMYLSYGNQGVESMEIYQFDYIFVIRNSGSNFTALNHWQNAFSVELDFPRMAASRIEERFYKEFTLPDFEFGTFYLNLIRAVSDSEWRQATTEDDFWMLSKIDPDAPASWDFLVLTAIPRYIFEARFYEIFDSVNARLSFSSEQQRSINRFRNNFFDDF